MFPDFRWRELWKLEEAGALKALIVVLPIIAGQLAGFPLLGLFAGFGGLMLTLTEKPDSTVASLLVATALNSLMVFAGTLASDRGALTVALMFVVALCGGLAMTRGPVAGQLGYIAIFVFALVLGQPPTLELGLQHLLEFAAGGAWATVCTLFFWRASGRRTLASAPAPTNAARPERETVRHALQIAIAAATAVAVFEFFDLQHGNWLITTALVIVKPRWHDTRERVQQRLTGSLIGGLAAVLLLWLVPNVIVLDATLLLFATLAFSHVRTNYRYYVIFLTPFVVLTLSSAAHGDWHLATQRVISTFIGAAIALSVCYLLRPRSSATA